MLKIVKVQRKIYSNSKTLKHFTKKYTWKVSKVHIVIRDLTVKFSKEKLALLKAMSHLNYLDLCMEYPVKFVVGHFVKFPIWNKFYWKKIC
jgi:hypothetical protein